MRLKPSFQIAITWESTSSENVFLETERERDNVKQKALPATLTGTDMTQKDPFYAAIWLYGYEDAYSGARMTSLPYSSNIPSFLTHPSTLPSPPPPTHAQMTTGLHHQYREKHPYPFLTYIWQAFLY